MKNISAPKPVIIGVLTLITVVFWIVFGILRIISEPEKIDVPAEVLEKLDPTLNTQILSTLEGRIHLTDDEIGSSLFGPTESSAPADLELSEIIVATDEADLATPVATSSAEVTQ